MAESASPTPPSSALKAAAPRADINRTAIGFNVAVQLFLVFLIIAFANTMSYRHYHRWDYSHNRNYALSSKTKNLLSHLDQPVHAIVFFTSAQILNKDVSGLLREYDYASNKKFTVEYVDPFRNLTRARELADTYKFGENDNIIILDYKGKSKFVNAQDLATFDNSGAAMGQPPIMRAFKGEEAITSALQGLLDEKQNKLYVISAHGEADLDRDAVAVFKEAVQRENIQSAMLNLSNVDTMPVDASGVMLFGPRVDYSEREIHLLNEFWNQRKGRLFILLNPDGKTPRLDEWLTKQGVKPQGDRVLRTGAIPANGVMQSGIFVSPDVIFAPEGRAVTKELSGAGATLLGFTESLLLDQPTVEALKIKVIPLMISGDGFWGETEYVAGSNQSVFFDPQKDYMGPLIVSVGLEKGGLEDPRVKVDTARMIVAGNAGFLTDRGCQLSPAGRTFAVLSLNWLFNRELVSGIPPKTKEALSLALNEKTMSNIFWWAVVAVPLGAGLFGLYVSWFRRNRSLLTLTVWVMGVGLFVVGAGWALNLYFESRESALNPVSLRSYAIPTMLAVVPLIIFIMHLLRPKPVELPLHPESD
jgi:hypothetical protein